MSLKFMMCIVLTCASNLTLAVHTLISHVTLRLIAYLRHLFCSCSIAEYSSKLCLLLKSSAFSHCLKDIVRLLA
ncbi:hypothetical protein B0O99DRAFT_147028 [Bisporella sp. PMI_857]|nr:hypothetical protein B0O99DRAFT_147028 [Bisporella sp. PMI_857]